MPLHKGLPWCTAVYETWFTEATLIEIGVSNAGDIFVDGDEIRVHGLGNFVFTYTRKPTGDMRDAR